MGRGRGQGREGGIGVLGLARDERVRLQPHRHAAGQQAFGPKPLGRPADMAGQGLAHFRQRHHRPAERPGGDHGFPGRGHRLQIEAGHSPQFEQGVQADHGHPFPDELPGQVPELAGVGHAMAGQHGRVPAPDAPHVLQADAVQQRLRIGTGREIEHPVQGRLLLGRPVGQLGQGLGGADADGNRDAGPAAHRLPDAAAVLGGIPGQAGQVEEGLVDGIHLQGGG